MANELFALLEEESQDRGTTRAAIVACTRAKTQMGSFFKMAASEADFDARLALVSDKLADIVREACIEQNSPHIDRVTKILASEIAHYAEIERGTPQDVDVAPSEGEEDEQMHVRGIAGRKLLMGEDDQEGESRTAGMFDHIQERGGEAHAPVGPMAQNWDNAVAERRNEKLDPNRCLECEGNGCAHCGGTGRTDQVAAQAPVTAPLKQYSKTADFGGPTGGPFPESEYYTEGDPQEEIARLTALLEEAGIDPSGIGEGEVTDPDPMAEIDPYINIPKDLHPYERGELQDRADGVGKINQRGAAKVAVETGDTYTQEHVEPITQSPTTVQDVMDASPKMDKSNAGDENHTSQKPIEIPSVANPTVQQDVSDAADYTATLEVPGVVKQVDADTPMQPELNAAPNTKTFPNKDQANPVTSKWKLIG